MGKQIYLPSIIPLSSYSPKFSSLEFTFQFQKDFWTTNFSSFNLSLKPSGTCFLERVILGLLTWKDSPEQETSDQRAAGGAKWWQVWKPENTHLLPLKEYSNHQKLLRKKKKNSSCIYFSY